MNILKNFKNILLDPIFYVPVILCVIVIMIGSVFQKPVQASMNLDIVSVFGMKFDLWSLSHLFLYIYFGYFFPQYFLEFLIIGSAWEIFESTYCKDTFLNIIGCDPGSKRFVCKSLENNRDCKYWYGKIDDVMVNMIGFVIGAAIAKARGRY